MITQGDLKHARFNNITGGRSYEEPFRVLEQDTYMEPLKVLQGTPNQGFFKEPLPMVLQRTPKGTSKNPSEVLQRIHKGSSENQ